MAATKQLRVLVVNAGGVLGGAESWLLSVLDATNRLDTTALLLSDGPLRVALAGRGIPVLVQPVGPRLADAAAGVARVAQLLHGSDYDVVLTNGVKAQVIAGPASALIGIPCVWVKHDFSYDSRLAVPMGKLATKVIATADEVGLAVRREDLVVVEPPRPGDPLPPNEAHARLVEHEIAITPGLRLLVMPSRLVPYKGIDTAIRALARREGAGWQLLAAGPDEPSRPHERARLLGLARDLGVSDRVQVAQAIPHLSQMLTAADCVAVLTRPDGPRTPGREGFGMVAMEAMLAGVPVIAVDDGGPIARRVGDAAGVLVPVDDPKAVARALAVLEDAGTRAKMGEAGRERTSRHPDAPACAQRVVRVLTEAAHRPGAGLDPSLPISVVSPILNEAGTIERLIDRVVSQMDPADEYILVDGSSTDGTPALVGARAASDPRVRMVQVPAGTTIGAARNAGVRSARHTALAFTDAGCLPDSTWLLACRAALEEPGVDLMVGTYRVDVQPGSLFQAAMAAAAWPDPDELRRSTPALRLYGMVAGRRFDPRRVDGRSLAVTRIAWERAGGFPEDVRTAEDEAFGRRARSSGGHSVLSLDANVVWRQRGTPRSTFRQFRGYGEGGGRTRSPLLLTRDAVRLVAYPSAVIGLARGGSVARISIALATAGYYSMPVARVIRRRQPPAAIALIPAVMLLKDVAKVSGAARTLVLGRRGESRRRT